MESYMKFVSELMNLEWSDAELLTLPEKYTNLMVHIALEKADAQKDEKIFYTIFLGGGERRTLLLKKHIEKTIGVFGEWNFYKVNKK